MRLFTPIPSRERPLRRRRRAELKRRALRAPIPHFPSLLAHPPLLDGQPNERPSRVSNLFSPSSLLRALHILPTANLSLPGKHQLHSRLLSLPPELRAKIWTHLLGNNLLHLTHTCRRLTFILCASPDPSPEGGHLTTCTCPYIKPFSLLERGIPYNDSTLTYLHRTHGGGLPVQALRACRQLYHEALPVLYGANIFDVENPYALIYLSRAVPPASFALIRHLVIRRESFRQPGECWNDEGLWAAIWALIANHARGLRGLRVEMRMLGGPGAQLDAEWCKDVRRVAGRLVWFECLYEDERARGRDEEFEEKWREVMMSECGPVDEEGRRDGEEVKRRARLAVGRFRG